MNQRLSKILGSVVFLGLVGVLLPQEVMGQVESFRIRHATVQEKNVVVFHNSLEAYGDATLEMSVAGKKCYTSPDNVRKPARDWSNLALLIVFDRGGKGKTGMAPYADDIVQGVHGFVLNHLSNPDHEKDVFAFSETPGEGAPGTSLEATNDQTALSSWLNNLGPSMGPGADIYGTTKIAMEMLNDVQTSFRGVIIISDGLDPHEKAGTKSHHSKLIKLAKERGIPVSALHIDRTTAVATAKKPRMQIGRGLMADVASGTTGEFKTIPVSSELRRDVQGALETFEERLSSMEVSHCQLCGDGYSRVGASKVSMVLKKGGAPIARARDKPEVTVQLQQLDYGPCPTESASEDAEATEEAEEKVCEEGESCGECGECKEGDCLPKTCQEDADCQEEYGCACTVCSENGECTPMKCASDEDCNEGCTCRDEACSSVEEEVVEEDDADASEEETAGAPEWIAPVLVLSGFLLLLLALVRRSQRKKKEAEEFAERKRQEELQQVEEKHRRAAEEQRKKTEALQEQLEQQSSEMKDVAQRMNPVTHRLVSVDGSITWDLRAGMDYVVGADPERANLVVDFPKVSGAHALLRVGADGHSLEVQDNQSSNGTYVNGFRISENLSVELKTGDTLGLSRSVELRVVQLA